MSSSGRVGPLAAVRRLLQTAYGRRFASDSMLPKHDVEVPPMTDDVAGCARLFDEPPSRAHDTWLELHADDAFRESLRERFLSTEYGPNTEYSNWRDLLYVLTRLLEPDRVVVTGVRGGLSSAYVLNALERNGHGELVSIDIGDTTLIPPDVEPREIGWIVPDSLRGRWTIELGDSTTLLQHALAGGRVELFLSDVPNDILATELDAAAAAMPSGGVVVTCAPADSAAADVWERFREESLSSVGTGTRWERADSRSTMRIGVLE